MRNQSFARGEHQMGPMRRQMGRMGPIGQMGVWDGSGVYLAFVPFDASVLSVPSVSYDDP